MTTGGETQYIPTYLSQWDVWRDMLPLPILAALVALAISMGLRRQDGSTPLQNLWFAVFSMALLGIVTGYVTGLSRESAVGAVLPAVLGLVGGVSVYILGVKAVQQQSLVVGVLSAFSLCLLLGIVCGSKLRGDAERVYISQEYRNYVEAVEQNVKLKRLVYQKQLIDAREAAKLPPDPEVVTQIFVLKKDGEEHPSGAKAAK